MRINRVSTLSIQGADFFIPFESDAHRLQFVCVQIGQVDEFEKLFEFLLTNKRETAIIIIAHSL